MFLKEMNKIADRNYFRSITQDEVLTQEGGFVRINNSITIKCDSVNSFEYDRVMPVFGDGSGVIWNYVKKYAYGDVLDIGTGSGILALEAAKTSRIVIGTDINPKSIKYAKVGAAINYLEQKCKFVEGDLYNPIKNCKFDTIISNPPFLPHPPSCKLFLSIDGGIDGLNISRDIIKYCHIFLKKTGRIILLTMSLGTENEPLFYKYLNSAFKSKNFKISTINVFEEKKINSENLYSLFSSFPDYSKWRIDLEKKGLHFLYLQLHIIESGNKFSHSEINNLYMGEINQYSGSWQGRLNRYKFWINNIYNNG